MGIICTIIRYVYVAWLQQEHPESLLKDFTLAFPDICPVMENTTITDNTICSLADLCRSSVQESSGTSPMDVQAPTKSLSISM